MGKLHMRTKKDNREYDITIDEGKGKFDMPIFAKDDWLVMDKFFEEKTTRTMVYYSIKKEVPRSCIESAEFIIQTLRGREPTDWQPGQSAQPNIYAHWGEGGVINISKSEDVVDQLSGKKALPFNEREEGGYYEFTQGLGLMIGNVAEKDTKDRYNMHLGAVVANHVDYLAAIYSDESEPDKDEDIVLINPWRIKGIQKPDEFRGDTYKDENIYKLGLLLPSETLPEGR